MNGVHDMGGMHGLGPIAPEVNEPVFHADWEKRVLAMNLTVGAWRRWNIDASRHEIELIPGQDYLRMSYYEKWFSRLVSLSLKAGLIADDEVASGQPAAGSVKADPPLKGEAVAAMLAHGGPANREVAAAPRFAPGDQVTARTLNPTGHIRLPRYVRGRGGVIVRHHGAHVLPDSNAHFRGEAPEALYTVRFSARELWGEQAPAKDCVFLDLWESYLEPA
jgi:nitrile hydratase beta subunit